MSRHGPILRIIASCHACERLKITPYRAQSDSGHNVERLHPNGHGHIGENRSDSTPQWRPMLSTLTEFTHDNLHPKVNRGGR